MGTGLVKVAVEAQDLSQQQRVIEGLKKLDRADPSVSVALNENGEYILSTCGEVHLERCLIDLQEDYAGCEVHVGEPIITYKETITMRNLKS